MYMENYAAVLPAMIYLFPNKKFRTVITCEHGGNKVPLHLKGLFNGREQLLASHRGYDEGSLSIAKSLSRSLDAHFIYSDITRLLIDLNRSPHHPKLFSEITKKLDSKSKKSIRDRYYVPYRRDVELFISRSITRGFPVLHISVHSFTPFVNSIPRNADIGLLYDPSRHCEQALCLQWQQSLRKADPSIRVRRNYPYLGKTDGLVTFFRKKFSPDLYAGIELEMNQSRRGEHKKDAQILCNTLTSCMKPQP